MLIVLLNVIVEGSCLRSRQAFRFPTPVWASNTWFNGKLNTWLDVVTIQTLTVLNLQCVPMGFKLIRSRHHLFKGVMKKRPLVNWDYQGLFKHFYPGWYTWMFIQDGCALSAVNCLNFHFLGRRDVTRRMDSVGMLGKLYKYSTVLSNMVLWSTENGIHDIYFFMQKRKKGWIHYHIISWKKPGLVATFSCKREGAAEDTYHSQQLTSG